MEMPGINGETTLKIGHSIANRLKVIYGWIEFDELMGVALLAAVQAGKSYDPSRAAKRGAFMCSKGYFLAVDDLRKNHNVYHINQVNKPKFIPESDFGKDNPFNSRSCPQETILPTSCSDLLRGLKPKQQKVLGLHFDGGISYKEIAQRMGITKSGVSRIKTAAFAEIKAHEMEMA